MKFIGLILCMVLSFSVTSCRTTADMPPSECSDGTAADGNMSFEEKWGHVMLPKVEFSGTPAWRACEWIEQQSKKLDPKGKGLSILVEIPSNVMICGEGRLIPYDHSARLSTPDVTLSLTNVSVDDAIIHVCMCFGGVPRYVGTSLVVVDYPPQNTLGSEETWCFTVEPAIMERLCASEPGGWKTVAATPYSFKKFWVKRGIPLRPGWGIAYDQAANRLIVCHNSACRIQIKRMLAEVFWDQQHATRP